jgi:glycosyltransferase involved in cell wall biosynthesis
MAPPRVSIGLPVYNGERFLELAIDSILAQTFADFELIISDNASTDRTAEICSKYARVDSRIRYSRNATNIGGANNANLTFRLSRGEYFRWAAHDDVCSERLLEKCVAVLDWRPELALCYTETVDIDEHGKRFSGKTRPFEGADTPFSRFRFFSSRKHDCEAVYGLMRASVVRKTGLMRNYIESDRVFLCEMGFHGGFHVIREPLFFKRRHAGNQYKDWRGRMAWFAPALAETGASTFPFWSLCYDYFGAVRRAPVSARQRALCHLWLSGPWLARFGKNMAKDVLVAGYMLSRSKEWRKRKYQDVDGWS